MAELVIDIETAGEPWGSFDKHTQEVLISRANRKGTSEDAPEEVAKNQLGLSPFTGKIIVLGALDVTTGKGAVYYETDTEDKQATTEGGLILSPSSEKSMLEKFWQLVDRYDTVVTYSGRSFDLPYIFIRSAVHGITPTKDFLRGRYIYQQQTNAKHIDLYDQLTYYGSVQNLGGLHLACRAFGIESPKDGHIDGAEVGQYYLDKRYQEIAEYNGRDLLATCALYTHWKKHLAF